MTTHSSLQRFQHQLNLLFRPPPNLTVSAWADAYATVSASSASPRWQTYPYQRALLDAFTEDFVETIVFQKSKQVGYTSVLNTVIGYHIHNRPSSILVVQPTTGMSEDYSRDEIQPMIDRTPELLEVMGKPTSRNSGNTIGKKRYHGDYFLNFIGANAPTGFRRVSCRLILFDEVDGYPERGAGVEGDQIALGIGRSEMHADRKISIGSTPTVKGTSRVAHHLDQSSQGYFFLHCPHCGVPHIRLFEKPENDIILRGEPIVISHLHYVDSSPSTAVYVCTYCGGQIPHRAYKKMATEGYWRGEHWDYRDGRFSFLPGFNRKIGFQIWAGYSFSPNATPAKIVEQYLASKDDDMELQTFHNTVLGQPWEIRAQRQSPIILSTRAKGHFYPIPNDVQGLSLGCDVQSDRLELEIVGWRFDRTSWSIDYQILPGDPSRDEVFDLLREVLDERYQHESGAKIPILMAFIDAGFLGYRVHAFAKGRADAAACKGVTGNRDVVESRVARLARLKKAQRKRTHKPELVGVDRAKEMIFLDLKRDATEAGFCHFPDGRDKEYYEQLASEELRIQRKRGKVIKTFAKMRERNEALDCRVYALAAMTYYGFERLTDIKPRPKIDPIIAESDRSRRKDRQKRGPWM